MNPPTTKFFSKMMTILSYYSYLVLGYIVRGLNFTKEKIATRVVNQTTIFFDFETTGLNPYHEQIIEYSFVTNDDKDKDRSINSLVNPQKKFDKKITDITGIHPDELENIPPIVNHKTDILKFINLTKKCNPHKDSHIYFVAHNCLGFDKMFLERTFHKQHRKNWFYIDTLVLAKKLLPGLSSYSLSSLAKKYSVTEGTHRALSDTKCLQTIYGHLLEELATQTNTPVADYTTNPRAVLEYCESV